MKEEFLNLLRQVKREGIDDLIQFIEKTDFFKAPASTRFHGDHEGGLVEHSMKVYEILKHKVEHNIEPINVNKETLAERGKINTDSPKWDKIILTIYWLLTFFVIYLVAGLEMNKADKPGIIFAMGIILQIPVTIISLKAMMVNTFLESTSRVQFDRSQIVCKEGPYKIIRHPTYLAILIWCISISMIFETKLVLIISIIIAGLIVIRTYLEDKMLKEKLKGYEEYSHEVKYRLIPLIW